MASPHSELEKLIKKVQEAETRWYQYPKVCWTETSGDVKFEVDKADVVFRLTNRVCFPAGIPADEVPLELRCVAERVRCTVEIKPTVGDDCTSVLRQMQFSGAEFLFLEEYTGIGMTVEQFRDMFAANGKTVVFKWEVDENYHHLTERADAENDDKFSEFDDFLD